MDHSSSFSSASSSVKSTSEREVSFIFLQTCAKSLSPEKQIPLEVVLVDQDSATSVADLESASVVEHEFASPEPSSNALIETQGTNMPVRCGTCALEFSSVRMKNLHERVAHHRAPCHRCPHCAGIFGHIVDLNQHLLHAHRGKSYDHVCEECDTAFASAVLLRQHVAKHVRRRLPKSDVRCSKCDFVSTCVGEVRFHMADKHGVWDDALGKENVDVTMPRRALRNSYGVGGVLLLKN